MRLALPPAFVLALLVALVGTQAAYLSAPGKPSYLTRLVLSVAAVGAGEGLAALGVGPRVGLGDVHVVNDLVLLAVGQWAATRWTRRLESRAPR